MKRVIYINLFSCIYDNFRSSKVIIIIIFFFEYLKKIMIIVINYF